MGDRGNIMVQSEWDTKDVVYLYSHWHGHELPEILQRALIKRLRWHDGSYLTRIIFCELVKGALSEETGFGISAKRGDGGVDILVNVKDQKIEYDGREWSFEQYIALSNPNKTLLDEEIEE